MKEIIVEHKTTAQDIGAGSPYWKRLTLDDQISTYLPGARALGYNPAEILYDVALRPSQRPYKATPVEEREYTKPKDKACPECKKKGAAPGPHAVAINDSGETRECANGRVVTDPGGRLYANMRELDETVEEYSARIRADIASDPDKYFRRGTIVRLEREEREAAEDTWTYARQIREAQLANRWPRNTDACETIAMTCDYWPVCSGEVSIDDPTRYRDADKHEELEATKEVDDGPKKVRLPLVTSSSMKSFRACPRRYYFAYELRRRSIERSEALRFGTLFHLGLEAWWKSANLDAAIAAMAGESDPFERAKAVELMRGYHARWINERIEVLAVEVEFETALVNPATGAESRTFRRAGKIDAIARVVEDSRESTAAA